MSEEVENKQPENDLGAPELPSLGDEYTGEVLTPPSQESDNGDPSVAGMLAGLSMMVFGMVADRRGEHWRLSESEAQEFGGAASAVIGKYFPDAKASPEMRLLMVSGAIIGMRVMVDISQRKKSENADEKAH